MKNDSMEQKPLFQQDKVQMIWQKGADAELIALLNATTYGQEGKIQYVHTQVESKIAQIAEPYFIKVLHGQRLIGVMGIMARHGTSPNSSIKRLGYIRYFSLPLRFAQNGNSIKEKPTKIKASHAVKQFVHNLFHDPQLLSGLLGCAPEELALYAYVEADNSRSVHMNQLFGMLQVATFNSFLFSRLSPSSSSVVSHYPPEQLEEVAPFFTTQLQKHQFFFADNLAHGHCFVVKEQGQIVAGLMAYPTRWRIKNIPGFSGKVYQHVFPHLPYLNRIINPANHRFLSFEGLACLPGREIHFPSLMETALHHLGYYAGQFGIDHNDALFPYFFHNKDLGLLAKVKKSIPVGIYVKTFSEESSEAIRHSKLPYYLSGFDMT
ncbi:hypothetical protein QWY31_00315 [Cytophagales bacterium LB-30]|uniref:GNAT family N-acetyltransferase n=1 Tax=Shiella aurantiaca TaxID=3058365 RepID=A0ABT8F0F2_9BACT|nr:hypothetical protein [Shiella aurantiaca]MDN4163918.1 hypothetical protein [Shiella aurantiaca]